jgi:serine/threonine protein kinase
MDPAVASSGGPAPYAFTDGLGVRRRVAEPARNEPVELLCLRAELTSVPSFEFALRERVSHLSAFRHPAYATVRSVERLKSPSSGLVLVSDIVHGARLSDVLAFAEHSNTPLDIDAALCLLRQIVTAVAALHQQKSDVAHGAIAAERIVVTPNARIVMVEHVLGAALGELQFSRERYWKELRVAVPGHSGPVVFSHRVDIAQIGVVALSLILGRPMGDDELPPRLGEVVASAWAISSRGGLEPLPAGLRAWLMRALQLDPRESFASAVDARDDLERMLESVHLGSPATLESFLAHYRAETEPHDVVSRAPSPAAPVSGSAFAAGSSPTPAPPQPMAAPAPKPAPRAADPAPRVDVTAPAASHAPRSTPLQPAYTAPAHTGSRSHEPVYASQSHAHTEHEHDHRPTPPGRSSTRVWVTIAVLAVIAAAGVATTTMRRFWAAPPPTVEGTLVVTTDPAGAHVFVDGVERGASPLTVKLKPGSHSLEVRGEGAPRLMPITIAAGAQLSQYLELPKAAAAVGQLQVRTEPAGARVSVDGVARGTSPTTIADLLPGEHAVTLESDYGTVKQTVTIEPGITASLMVPLSNDAAPVSGWLAIQAPAELQVFENKRLLGTSQMDRLMVGAGRHELELVNETLGYRATRTVQVVAGKVAQVRVEFPKGTIALNAVPWGEVWLDGEKVGETPIGNLSLTIGTHDVLFRHPDFGEQRHKVTVTLTTPARLSVDLRKK